MLSIACRKQGIKWLWRSSALNLSSSGIVDRSLTTTTTTLATCTIPWPTPIIGTTQFNNKQNPFFQQVRWKRKDGNRYHMKERPPTKKQRKRYHRKLQETQKQAEKHGAPGSKAGARREWAKQWKEDILNPVPSLSKEELEKYTIEEALLDDLIGNTSEAQPTPQPTYLGHKQRKYYNRVADQMDDFRQKTQALINDHGGKELMLGQVQLPSDLDLSKALRAHRDREGTRKRPIGIVKALKYLLQDIGVPVTALGEMTYTTLLTCALSPVEGRRIIQMMQQQRHPVSAYSWSILVDVYARVGDYKGCLEVHREMIAEGIKPTLPSFTSLLAACYKVVIDGRVSHKLRTEAAKVAWEQWQEMRIVGIDPDVMAYGAILRIMAARGQPERALNILEEMQLHGIAPTTLCFTSALRAVARSHATAIRYEHGSTRRNNRREFITSHHGKLAQSIVRMAESAEVEQDDGFIAALISCAAAAGDLPTAKAVYVANQIRRMDQFRTIGSDDHLAQLRGEGAKDDLDQLEYKTEQLSDGSLSPSSTQTQLNNSNANKSKKAKKKKMSYGEREYGKDSRILSAVMQACANAAGSNMVGSMWQGRENEGYLCENSIRLIAARGVPKYVDNSIPGAGRTDNLTWAGDEKDLDRRGNKRMSGKFTGVHEDDNVAMSLDELDETFSRYFTDKEGRRLPEYQKVTPKDIWNERYGSRSGINEAYGRSRVEIVKEETKVALPEGPRIAPMHFNLDTMKWEDGPQVEAEKASEKRPASSEGALSEKNEVVHAEVEEELYFDSDSMRWKSRPKIQGGLPSTTNKSNSQLKFSGDETPRELVFDSNDRSWKVKDGSGFDLETALGSDAAAMQTNQTKTVEFDEEAFADFFAELKQDVRAAGDDPNDIDEDEARELFAAIEGDDELIRLLDEEGSDAAEEAFMAKLAGSPPAGASAKGLVPGAQASSVSPFASVRTKTNVLEMDNVFNEIDDDDDDNELFSQDRDLARLAEKMQSQASLQGMKPYFDESFEVLDDEEADADLEELRAALPAFSDRRLRKVQRAFAKNLGNPSILDLVKISRETMPDYVSNTWLKHMSTLTARYVMKQAISEGLLDVHMLNGVLQLETSLGRLDRALEFYQTEFSKHGLEPTAYSDRLMVQMFLHNNRFSRALSFKEYLEGNGRTPDLQSYGSLIDYCARRGQVGSAMLLLHECLQKHNGEQPGQAHLAQLRIAYRKASDLDEKDLELLIGADPIRWLKHGEAHLKREMSKKGRRDVKLARDVLLQI